MSRFPHVEAWLARMWDRPAVKAGRAVAADKRQDLTTDRAAQRVLFGQTARD